MSKLGEVVATLTPEESKELSELHDRLEKVLGTPSETPARLNWHAAFCRIAGRLNLESGRIVIDPLKGTVNARGNDDDAELF